MSRWFYSNVHPLVKFFQIYVKGDGLVILPLFAILLTIGYFNTRLFIVAMLVFITLRHIGEMMYWIARQFSEPDYRPDDFGFKNLNTKAIYILYQLFAIAGATISSTLLIYVLFF